tara:strand:+ start:7488 stop:9626 length:2139 start_codon:yes stop_codon:yes gene_type:complete
MPFQISPGVNITEKDLTNIVPAVATTVGGIAGYFQWGPCEQRVLIDGENNLVSLFGKPDDNTSSYWHSANNFLGYSNALQVVRKIPEGGYNAIAGANGRRGDTVLGATGTGILLKNADSYYETVAGGTNPGILSTGLSGASDIYFAAKYPGALGNSLKVSMSDGHVKTFVGSSPNGGVTATVDTNYLNVGISTGANLINGEVAVGDIIKINDTSQAYTVKGFSGGAPADASCISLVDQNGNGGLTAYHTCETADYTDILLNETILTADAGVGITASVQWAYAGNFPTSPDTSTDAAKFGAVNDEIHIAVVDEGGKFSGAKGTLLERWTASKAQDSKSFDGTGNYYVNKINKSSNYIWWGDHPDGLSNLTGVSGAGAGLEWGGTFTSIDSGASGATFESLTRNFYSSLIAGNDGVSFPNASLYLNGYDLFEDSETVDCSLLVGGPAEATLSGKLIDLVDARKDCLVFLSPLRADVVDRTSATIAQDAAVSYYNNTLNKSSSFGVFDSGWKYQYDKFRDVYCWVPLNGDIAGLCARTENDTDAWWSPAGFNRGQIRNIVKLSYNPRKAHRDNLYKNNLNPVVSFPGEGTVLFGDKTMQRKPSAFDRINVRRLFIVLEKAISTSAKYQLFEFNDEFTRANFVNLVTPFLRDIQGKQGIQDFRVVCNETNNTSAVIDRNEFVADIYIKPARSINFIQLNFVAVRSGVEFTEIAGEA